MFILFTLLFQTFNCWQYEICKLYFYILFAFLFVCSKFGCARTHTDTHFVKLHYNETQNLKELSLLLKLPACSSFLPYREKHYHTFYLNYPIFFVLLPLPAIHASPSNLLFAFSRFGAFPKESYRVHYSVAWVFYSTCFIDSFIYLSYTQIGLEMNNLKID